MPTPSVLSALETTENQIKAAVLASETANFDAHGNENRRQIELVACSLKQMVDVFICASKTRERSALKVSHQSSKISPIGRFTIVGKAISDLKTVGTLYVTHIC